MTESTATSSLPVVRIINVDTDGVFLHDGERSWVEPWDAVSDIQAARIPVEQSTMLVLALGFRDERMVLVAEEEQVWEKLAEAIQFELPDAIPINIWQSALSNLGQFPVYERPTLS